MPCHASSSRRKDRLQQHLTRRPSRRWDLCRPRFPRDRSSPTRRTSLVIYARRARLLSLASRSTNLKRSRLSLSCSRNWWHQVPVLRIRNAWRARWAQRSCLATEAVSRLIVDPVTTESLPARNRRCCAEAVSCRKPVEMCFWMTQPRPTMNNRSKTRRESDRTPAWSIWRWTTIRLSGRCRTTSRKCTRSRWRQSPCCRTTSSATSRRRSMKRLEAANRIDLTRRAIHARTASNWGTRDSTRWIRIKRASTVKSTMRLKTCARTMA